MNPLNSYNLKQVLLVCLFWLFALAPYAQVTECDCFTECDNLVRNGGFEGVIGIEDPQSTADIPCWVNVSGTPHVYDRDNDCGSLLAIPGVSGTGLLFDTHDLDISNNQVICVAQDETISTALLDSIPNNSSFEISIQTLWVFDSTFFGVDPVLG